MLQLFMNRLNKTESSIFIFFSMLFAINGSILLRFYLLFKPAHDKAYNKTCATSEDLDQPANPRSLTRVFADRMCLLQPPGYPKRDKRETLHVKLDRGTS